jgi:hypothetical protein
MTGEWKEVVRLRFKGARFQDHALDLSALAELSQFQKLVAETAKAIWRAGNPGRERLPAHFEQRTRLCLRKVEDGSAVTPLEVWIGQPEDPELFDPEPEELNQAVALAHDVFTAVEHDTALPDCFPRHLVSEYAKWGQTLAEDEEVEMDLPNRTPARVAARFRERLAGLAEAPYEDAAEVVGEVLEADVRQRRFQLWREDKVGASVSASFDENQEEFVTTALKGHKVIRLRVRGRGEFLPTGQMTRFTRVESLEIVRVDGSEFDETAPAIEDVLASIAAEVPNSEWDRLPRDLTDDLDRYLYGTPQR